MNNARANAFAPALSAVHIAEAHALAAETRRPQIEILEEQMGLAPGDFVVALADAMRYRPLDMHDLNNLTPAFEILPFKDALTHRCLPLRNTNGSLLVATSDPFDTDQQAWAQEQFAVPFVWCLAHRKDLDAFLTRHEESMRAMDSVLTAKNDTIHGRADIEDLSIVSISKNTSPVIKLVQSTLYDALKIEASDIHLETCPDGLNIKYRIDGVLSLVGKMSGLEMAEQVISRVKVMAELDIAERRIPQDGRFKVTSRGREIDVRVSIMPSIFGEDAVLRILDKQALSDQIKGLRLDYLGFDAVSMKTLRRLAKEPYGMLLVTGPTGSGKTTTLYAAISEINHGQDKIITIEDPVEYMLPGVLQIPVNEKKGLTFARGLRSILRHDPDKIMVGEIRDAETAQIAVQSALTGHLVFTTVHANNVFDVIGRFLHMDVTPSSFVSALNGIVAQRLVRQNCPHCTQPYVPSPELLAESGITRQMVESFKFQAGIGCGHCRGTGYRGRRAIAELLYLNDEIRELISTNASIGRVKEAARRNGTRLLRESALDLVRDGLTTLQEINRVTLVA
ncbi:MAG: type II/IV secretion system protein [Gammaproteobacteria bacterium]|nr:type II/IV secretion system protein [Gammaproteobacteria bacterium]